MPPLMPPKAWKVVKKEPENGNAPPQTAFPDLASAQQVANTRRTRSNARTFWNSDDREPSSSVQRTRLDELNNRANRWRHRGRVARDIAFRDDLQNLPETSSDMTLEEEDRRASIASIRIYDKSQNSGLGVWASLFQPPADPLRTRMESSSRKFREEPTKCQNLEKISYQKVLDPAEMKDCPTLADLKYCLAQCTRTHRADALERKQDMSDAFHTFFDMVEICIASPVMLYRVSLRGRSLDNAAINFIRSSMKELPADIQNRFRSLVRSALASNATHLAAAGAGLDPQHGIVQYASYQPDLYPRLTTCALLAIELCDMDDSRMIEQLTNAVHTESWKQPDEIILTYETNRLANLATQLSRAVSWSIGQHYYAETAPKTIPIAADSDLYHLLMPLEHIWECNMRRSRGDRCDLTSFYSSATELPFIINDYQQWIRSTPAQADVLYFCDWPYALTMGAKVQIVAWEARQALRQASTNAWLQPTTAQRRSQVTRGIEIAEGNLSPSLPICHDQGVLSVHVRRTHIIQDSLFLLDLDAQQLFQPMKVTFDQEIAQDAGGIQKEFLLLLCEALCDPSELFSDIGEAPYEGVLWFSPNLAVSELDESSETYRRIQLLGLTFGLALVSGVTLNVSFPRYLYECLLDESVANIEIFRDLDTLRQIRPTLAASLSHLLDYDESNGVSLEDAMRLSWTIPYGDQTYCLASEPRPVTASNRAGYVQRVCSWMLHDAVRQPIHALTSGFARITAPPVSLPKSPLQLLQAEELETLLRGRDERVLDVDALRANTTHVGFPVKTSNYAEKVSSNLEHFWSLWKCFDAKSQHALLGYITGSPRVPAMGASSIGLRIQHIDDASSILGTDHIPWSSTCTSTLFLPVYESRNALETKLRIALQHSVGFGLA
ncbi:HECT-type E3 ubiquitin transferase [Malassezia yamatoensis]|uniref:HECT-type E3 ubiquitin transferase n=1 Tax=Malassezia yamatoensis TaxID=253288 RepID=A0AAJ5YRW4_9BASI|nr:HECT-type E3 ubiquitin transferase [Malassezia yamatoensis]